MGKKVSRAGNVETKVLPNFRDEEVYCVDVLTSASVPIAFNKQAMRLLFNNSHLLNNHMSTNVAMAAIFMVSYCYHEIGRMMMCIFMSESAPAVSLQVQIFVLQHRGEGYSYPRNYGGALFSITT